MICTKQDRFAVISVAQSPHRTFLVQQKLREMQCSRSLESSVSSSVWNLHLSTNCCFAVISIAAPIAPVTPVTPVWQKLQEMEIGNRNIQQL